MKLQKSICDGKYPNVYSLVKIMICLFCIYFIFQYMFCRYKQDYFTAVWSFFKNCLVHCLASVVFTVYNLARQNSPSALWVSEKMLWYLSMGYCIQTWMEALPHTKCLQMPSLPYVESRVSSVNKTTSLSLTCEEKNLNPWNIAIIWAICMIK